MAGPLLEVAGLTVSARNRVLVQDFALSLARGERVGLIGESGSGKSMTAAALMGLLPEGVVAAGSVRLDGTAHDLIGASDRQMSRLRGKRMGMVFQEPLSALNPLMKVGRQVAEALKARGFAIGVVGNSTVNREGMTAIILSGPDGESGAFTMQQQIPDTQYIQDDREDASVDVVLGSGYSDLVPLETAQAAAPGPITCPWKSEGAEAG